MSDSRSLLDNVLKRRKSLVDPIHLDPLIRERKNSKPTEFDNFLHDRKAFSEPWLYNEAELSLCMICPLQPNQVKHRTNITTLCGTEVRCEQTTR